MPNEQVKPFMMLLYGNEYSVLTNAGHLLDQNGLVSIGSQTEYTEDDYFVRKRDKWMVHIYIATRRFQKCIEQIIKLHEMGLILRK